MAETLAKTPGKSVSDDFAQLQQNITERSGKELQTQQELVGAETELKRAELGTQAELATKKAEKQREIRTEFEQEIAGLEKQMLPAPDRKMTQEDASTYAQLASMVATLGLMLGGGAKGSSKVAIGAMTGMMKGWQQGRKDLWDREAKTFEAEMKKIKAQNDEINRRIERAYKLMPLRRDEAMAELEAVSYLSNQGILPQYQKAMNLRAMVENQKSVNKVLADTERAIIQERRKEAQHQENLSMQRARMASAERIAAMRTQNLAPAEKKELRGYTNLAGEMERLKATFKPEYADFVIDAAGKWKSLFEARVKDNPAMANWWRAYENVAMPERHSMFGATLTGGEREAWRAASIGPGNSVKEIGTWFDERIRSLNNRIQGFERVNEQRRSEATSDPLGILSD